MVLLWHRVVVLFQYVAYSLKVFNGVLVLKKDLKWIFNNLIC